MLIFICGDNFKKINERVQALVDDFLKKGPDAVVLKINEDNQSEYSLSGLAKEQGLFEREIMAVFSFLLMSDDFKEIFLEKIKELVESKNLFVFLEIKPDKALFSALKKCVVKPEEYFLPEQKTFSPFSLADAYGARDKKKLWVNFHKAVANNLSAEEIHGLLFWQIKNILISKIAKNLGESGLAPFPFQKAKIFSKNFSEEELKKHSSLLVDIYHRSRKGLTELPIGLEKFILQI